MWIKISYMKTITNAYLFFLLSLLASGINGVNAQGLNLRIMSFNIQQPYGGTNWEGRKANAAFIINTTQADVIGTQEAINSQRDYLIQQTGYKWFGTGRDGGDSGEGSWVFYRGDKYTLDQANSGSFWLSTTPTVPSRFDGSYNRICTYVRLVEITSGKGFYVFNAHFPTPDLSTARMQSMKLLVQRISNRAINDPVYITGDFNSSEGDAVTLWMKNGADNPLKCRDTYRDFDPNGSVNTGFGTKFDYIYCPNDPNYTTSASWVVTSPEASDHRPIVAEVSYSSGVVVEPDPTIIPGKLEAENYSSMSGVQLEDTEDEGGGKNIGFLDAGDWVKYKIDVSAIGDYKLELRSAGESATGSIDIYVDNTYKKSISLTSSGGWQLWKSTIGSLELDEGLHELRIDIKTGGFNLNWIRFSENTPTNDFQVKVVSANLWRLNNDWATRKPNVVSLINGELPDVVGIQEGDEGKQADLADDLSNYQLETGPWNDQSTAILYHSGKVSVVETGVFGFSSQPDNKTVSDWGDGAANGWLRVCNWVLFEQVASGGRFYVYNTHLDANGFTPNAGEWRSKEVRLIAERIASRTHLDYPFILVGDLNGVENEEAITYLKSGLDNPVKMVDTYRVKLPNGPGDSFGSVKYDYVMVENTTKSQVVDANIIYHNQYGWTSDHNQVFATINFLKEGVNVPIITNVTHTETNPKPMESILIAANVVDTEGITEVTLNWGTSAGVFTNSQVMSASGDVYSTTVAGQVDKTTIYYQIEATDLDGNTTTSSIYSIFISDEEFGLYADYDVVDMSFTGFGGSTFQEVDNPFVTAGNPSAKVGRTVQGAETWAGIYSQTLTSIDFESTPIFKMKVYGPKTGNILIKFEDESDENVFYDESVPLTQVNQWTEISVNFSGVTSGLYEKLVLFFDYDNGAEDTYYFDDLRLESIITDLGLKTAENTKVSFVPNPASEKIQFSEKCDWVIFSTSGVRLLQGQESHGANIGGLLPGMYIIQIGQESHRLVVQ